MTPEPLSAVEQRAVHLLERGPMRCSELGELLWGVERRSAGTCPWARAAGALVKRLRERGLVRRAHAPDDRRTLYELAPR
jgi:hypothetical protein